MFNSSFFFYNNFLFLFLQKLHLILTLFKNDIIFVTDNFFKKYSDIEDLNLFFSKKNFFYYKNIFFNSKMHSLVSKQKFFFFFFSDFSLSNLTAFFFFFNKNSGLLLYTCRPDIFQFGLPVVVDYSFSLFFYKFFFYKFFVS